MYLTAKSIGGEVSTKWSTYNEKFIGNKSPYPLCTRDSSMFPCVPLMLTLRGEWYNVSAWL